MAATMKTPKDWVWARRVRASLRWKSESFNLQPNLTPLAMARPSARGSIHGSFYPLVNITPAINPKSWRMTKKTSKPITIRMWARRARYWSFVMPAR